MEKDFIADKKFEKVNYVTNPLDKGEYEACVFIDCDFTGSDLEGIVFSDCEFRGCNLSLVKLSRTVFRDAIFKKCKMLGLHFEECNEYALSFVFIDCNLTHTSFFGTRIKNSRFKDSQLVESDFTASDLTGSLFDNCDLRDAVFEDTNLEKVDFLTSYYYTIDPDKNQLKKTKFSATGLSGLLAKYDIIIE